MYNFVNLDIDFRLMRFILIIFLAGLFGFSCVKPQTKDPVPFITFKDFTNARKSEFTGQDTAVFVLGYEDGDGNLFVDNSSQGPNLIITPYFYNKTTGKFVGEIDLITKDTFRIPNSIVQPDNGYYKGKSIKGEIFIPMREFRLNDSTKILKFSCFMQDTKNNKSNVVASPAYTLNF